MLLELDDSAKMLSDFGLTPYEAKVYLAAVRLGLTSASRISKVTSIRREEVYRTLPKLENAGLIDRVLGRPVKVRALPMEDALTMLIKRREEEAEREISDLMVRKKDLLDSFQEESLSIEPEEHDSHFILVSEKDAVTTRIISLISRTENEIEVVDSSENIVRFVMQYAENLERAYERNVSLRILTECPDDESLIPNNLQKHLPEGSFTLKYIDDFPSRYILFDGTEAMLTTSAGGTFSDSKSLWTDDESLVALIRSNFQDQLRNAQDWESFKWSTSERMDRILGRLKPRDHAILVYDSSGSKHYALFNYIKQGLENGEAATYVCWEEPPVRIKDAMKEFGLKVSKWEKAGALNVINYTDIYIRDGRFSIEDVVDSWGKLYEEAISNGFKGMRVTGEMGCFMEHSLVEELIEYEKALHTILDIPMTAICAYSAEILAKVDRPIDVYSELVKAHGKVLFAERSGTAEEIEIRIA